MSISLPIRSAAPIIKPVYTKGNQFWRGDERFLIKGMTYNPTKAGSDPEDAEPTFDALAEDRIWELERDIEVFRQLGLNTIRVVNLQLSVDHGKALRTLAEAGIYVIVEIGERIKPLPRDADPDAGTHGRYTSYALRRALAIVDELVDHPNLLGFIVRGNTVGQRSTKMAEVCRALVRDTKSFLKLRKGRVPLVGIRTRDYMMNGDKMLQYFTAGSHDERVDFFANDCWSWANVSSFQISGWQNMVETFESVPVPMFLSEYGTYVGKPRIWDEVRCLYSPDMTGVFSGGCLYTYYNGSSPYGIVDRTEDGRVQRKEEFFALKQQFEAVNQRTPDELFVTDAKDYEGWTGTFPATTPNRWRATSQIPQAPFDLESFAASSRPA